MDYINQYILENHPLLADSALAKLDSDGYVSLSLYYGAAAAGVKRFSNETSWSYRNGYLNFTSLKIVTLDGDGEILKISEVFTIKETSGAIAIKYHYKDNIVEVTYPPDTMALALFGTLLFVGIIPVVGQVILSVVAKTLVALPFRVKPFWLVPIIALVSQIMATFTAPFIFVSLPYMEAAVAAVALFVSVAEYLVYRVTTARPKGVKLVVFVLVANLASIFVIFIVMSGLF
jgi:hypothetical protein